MRKKLLNVHPEDWTIAVYPDVGYKDELPNGFAWKIPGKIVWVVAVGTSVQVLRGSILTYTRLLTNETIRTSPRTTATRRAKLQQDTKRMNQLIEEYLTNKS